MRTCKVLRGLSILTLFFFAEASFGQTPTQSPVPLIIQVTPPSLSPASIPPGSNHFTLTVLGANFAPGEQVTLTGPGGSTAMAFNPTVNATGTQMVANFANVFLPVPGTLTVTVTKRANTGAPLLVSNPYYLPVTPSAQTAVLEPPVTSFLQGAPNAMAAADFNGDGVPDLAVISQGPSGSSAVSILIGSFGGVFTVGASYPTGNAPSGVVAADFNGDHVLDLAVTNAMDNTVTIFLGNGDGTFRPGTTINDPGVYPTQIVAADFNGDGQMDLAVLNLCGTGQYGCYPAAAPMGPGNVEILLGNGDGTFNVAPALPATGLAPSAMAAADLNQDGFIDLVVANSSNNLTLLMGNGDGTFSAASNTPSTGNVGPPQGIAIGDFNGEGTLDVAVTSSGDNAVAVLLNQNCAGLPAPQCSLTPAPFPTIVPTGLAAIATADMNADGLLDLVVVNSGAGTVSILLGDGTGKFNPLPWPNQSFSTGSSPQALALLDFNQDGRLDVVTANQSASYSLLRQAAVMQLQLTTNNSAFVYGYVPTLTMQLTPPPGAPAGPTGTVSLLDGSTPVTSATLSGYQYQIQFVLPPGYLFGAGTHQLTAVYSGDTNFAPATSNAVTETVATSATTTALSSNLVNGPYGTSVTLTASIQPQAPAPATGTVTFTDTTNSTTIGTATVSSNSAQLTLTNLGAGSHAIVATYQGDGNCTGSSSSSVSVTITQASTTLTLGESPTQAQFAQPVRFTASLPFSGNNPATGTVTFYDGATSLGTVSISNNLAALSVSTLSVGTHAISAQYSGDSNFLGSSGNTTETIIPCSTTVTLTAGVNPSVYGSYVSMSATITPAFGSFPAEGVSIGQVAFYDGTTLLGTQNIMMSPALLSVQTLTAGNHTLTAQWLGNTNYAPSTSNAVTQTVTQAASTTSVYTLKNPSAYGQSVTVDVAVDNIYHLISSGGTITLFDNGTQIATGAMSQGIAFFPLATLAVGAHSLTASYSGDNDLKPSTSSTFTQNVSQATTTTSVSLSAPFINFGQSATLTATVQPAYTGTPTGTVIFLDGTTTLGSSSITNGSAQFTASGLTPGAHNISAKYSGDTNFTGSNSAANPTMTVNQATTTTSVSSSLNPSTYGQLVTFSATVQAGSGTGLTGSATFLYGSVTLGTVPLSNGTAQLAVSSLAGGSQSITAQYSGDSNFAGSTSPALTETVNPAATSTVIAASTNPATFGQAVTLTATVQRAAGSTATGTVTFLDGTNSLGTATLSNNNAQLSVSTLAIGSHSITAAYSGTTNFAASTSAILTETVSQAPTTTTFTASPNPSVFNQSVSFVITVSAAAGGTPTGTISLMDGSATLTTATLSGGVARIYYGGLSPATHSITAVYSGDPNFTTSTSAAQNVVVNQASSTTALSSSLNPSTYGQAVTLTATVQAPQGINPFGAVTFMDGSVTLGSSSLSNGSAQFTLSGLAAGSHTITAVYAGNTYLTGSTSTGLAQSVSSASSATTVSSSINPAAFGQTVVFSATIQPAFGGSATGTVTFLDGTVALGSSPVSGNVAQLSLSSLAVGSHALTAKYSGDSNVAGSTSAALTQTVSQAATTTTVTSGANPAVFGQSVTFSVRIQSSASGTPTGSVTLMDGSSSLGSAPLPANGVAQFAISSLAGGAHTISASYSGDANYAGSSSSVLTQTVNPASSTVSIAVSPNPAAFGQAVMLTASVTPAVSGDQATGVATFFDGATSLGTANLSNNSAQLSVSNLAVGSHSITAQYAGDANFGGSTSAALTETVNPATTTTTLASNLNPATFGQPVTLTATVQAGSGVSVAGTVTFLDGSQGLGTVALANNSAQMTTSTLAPGTHTLTAVYNSNGNFAGSTSAALTETVNQLTTTTTLTSNANPALAGQNVMLTATVQAGAGNSAVGTVTFLDGSTTLGSTTVTNNSAQLTISTLAPGSHSLTATYNGSTDFAPSTSTALTETVNQSSTTTTVASNLNPATFGQAVPFVATVQTASGGAATGRVTFYDGSATLGTATVTNNGSQHNVATLTFTGLQGGTHTITAAYGGDANYAASTSGALTETINPASSSVAVGVSSNPASFEQPVILTATVVPSVSGTLATGTVTFFDGTSSLGTDNFSNNVAQISVSNFALGSHSITASYAGDRNFAGSTSAALSEVVNPAATSTVVTSSANPSLVKATVTFTATVSSSSAGTQSGTVSFYLDGSSTAVASVNLSGGTAHYSTNSLSAGSHSVVAVFTSSNPDFAGSRSAAFAQLVSDFTVGVSPSSLTVARGTSATYTLTVTPVGEFGGTVSMSCGGVPGGTTCTISPTQVTLSGASPAQATVTINAAQNASKGTHTLTFTGTSGGLNHKITASLTID